MNDICRISWPLGPIPVILLSFFFKLSLFPTSCRRQKTLLCSMNINDTAQTTRFFMFFKKRNGKKLSHCIPNHLKSSKPDPLFPKICLKKRLPKYNEGIYTEGSCDAPFCVSASISRCKLTHSDFLFAFLHHGLSIDDVSSLCTSITTPPFFCKHQKSKEPENVTVE